MHKQFSGEEDQGCPDDAETDETGLAEGFVVNENADEELDCGGNILQNADHCQWDQPRTGYEGGRRKDETPNK